VRQTSRKLQQSDFIYFKPPVPDPDKRRPIRRTRKGERAVALFLIDGKKVGTIRFLDPTEITKDGRLKAKVRREMESFLGIESLVNGRKPAEIVGPIVMEFDRDGDILSPPEYATFIIEP